MYLLSVPMLTLHTFLTFVWPPYLYPIIMLKEIKSNNCNYCIYSVDNYNYKPLKWSLNLINPLSGILPNGRYCALVICISLVLILEPVLVRVSREKELTEIDRLDRQTDR